LAQNFANGMQVLKASGEVALQLFRDWVELGSKAQPVTEGLSDGLRLLGDGISEMFDALAPHMGSIGDALRSIFEIAGELLGPIGELTGMFADALAPILDKLVPVVADLAEAFLAIAGPLLDALSPALTHIIENCLQPLAALLSDELGDLLPPLAEAFGEWWMVLAKLTEPLTSLAMELLPLFVDLMVRWLDALEPIWPEVQQLAQVIADELIKAFVDMAPHLPAMADAFLSLVEAVAPYLPQLIELAALIASIVIPAIAWFVTALLDLHAAFFGPIADAISWAGERIPAVWSWIKDRVAEHVGLIRQSLDWFASLHVRMYEWVNSAKNAAVDRFWSLVDWVSGLPGRLLAAVGNLDVLMQGKGQDFVRGIWNGINSMGSWLYNKVWDWIKRQLPEPVRAALGIASPSKVAEELAREFPAGLVVGLDSGSKDVEQASLRLASTVQSGFALGGDGASLPTADSSPPALGAVGVGASGSSISIQQLIVQVQGVVDLTDPYAMDAAARDFVLKIREALRTVEASQA
jgi:phage-related protein